MCDALRRPVVVKDDGAWGRAAVLIAEKSPAGYDAAAEFVVDLGAVTAERDPHRVEVLRVENRRGSGLIRSPDAGVL